MLEYIGISFGVLVAFVTIWLVAKYLPETYINEGSMKEHSWKSVKILGRACYCSVCGILTSSNGFFCECCGICADRVCMKIANKKWICKASRTKEAVDHLWVRGNLPLACECFICLEDIDHHAEPGLYGYRCCWCQRSVHDHCYSPTNIPETKCDFGEFRDMIIPPQCIRVAKIKGTNKIHLTKLNPPEYYLDWKPLIVIVNIKSGSSVGNDVIALFRGVLNPLQVFHLGSNGPQQALQWVAKASPIKCRILVAGGDGSVGWILNTINHMKIQPPPEVGILPLGTGNDLSRILGWGAESSTDLNPISILHMIKRAKPIQLDRWMVEISGQSALFLKQSRNMFMYNYLSIGVDALVTLNFHKARESAFYIYSHRIVNKILYLMYGTQQVVQQDCLNLETKLEVFLDKRKLELPELQSVVISNIDSWGAGVRLWELSKSPERKSKCSISDGTLEVYGVISSFHIAQLQVGLSKPIFLGHAKDIKINLFNTCPIQIDGEPWSQKSCEIKITKNSEATMLEYK